MPPYAKPIVGSDPLIAPSIFAQVSRRHLGMPPYAKPIVGSDPQIAPSISAQVCGGIWGCLPTPSLS